MNSHNVQKTFFALMILFASIVFVQSVYASPSSPVFLDTLSSSSRELPSVSNGSISAQGGNITQVNIEAITITKAWQGYYGNISGNIVLDDADNNSFYSWGNASSLAGEVYATRNSTIQWQNIRCLNGSERADEETYLGQIAVSGDSVTNTFNNTAHPSFYVGTVPIGNDTCFSTNANVNGTSQQNAFYQILLSDNSSNSIYTTIIENKKHAFNGQIADFQLMVGENEHTGNVGPTSYYFFVELS